MLYLFIPLLFAVFKWPMISLKIPWLSQNTQRTSINPRDSGSR